MCESPLKLGWTVFKIAGYTKLIVIGGYNAYLGGYLSSVEVIDLENPTNTCNLIADYPVAHAGMTVGIIGGLIKSCGSSSDTEMIVMTTTQQQIHGSPVRVSTMKEKDQDLLSLMESGSSVEITLIAMMLVQLQKCGREWDLNQDHYCPKKCTLLAN